MSFFYFYPTSSSNLQVQPRGPSLLSGASEFAKHAAGHVRSLFAQGSWNLTFNFLREIDPVYFTRSPHFWNRLPVRLRPFTAKFSMINLHDSLFYRSSSSVARCSMLFLLSPRVITSDERESSLSRISRTSFWHFMLVPRILIMT